MTTSLPPVRRAGTISRVPMTAAASSALRADLARGDQSASGRLDRDLRRRHEVMAGVLRSAYVTADPGLAAIGRRVTYREPDGERVTVALVIPGDGDPRNGWIGIDAPLGAALIGSRPGTRVTVHAPSADRTIIVEAIH